MLIRGAVHTHERGANLASAVLFSVLILALGLPNSASAQSADSLFTSLLQSVQDIRDRTIDDNLSDPEVDALPFSSEVSTSRFLAQATFGATRSDVSSLVGTSVSDWLLEQFRESPSDYLATLDSYQAQLPFLILNPWNRHLASLTPRLSTQAWQQHRDSSHGFGIGWTTRQGAFFHHRNAGIAEH